MRKATASRGCSRMSISNSRPPIAGVSWLRHLVAATWELNLGGVPPIAVENTGSSGGGAGRVVLMAMYARNAELHAESELTEELKKIKKHLM